MQWRIPTIFSLATAALALGFVITAAAVSLALMTIIQDEEAAFGVEIGAVKDNLVQRLTSANEVLHGMRMLFDASSFVDVHEFQVIGNDTVANYPFIKAVMYLPYIAADEREYFEKTKQEEGYPTFSINTIKDGSYVPAERRPSYFPILYLEPFLPSAAQQLGLDLLGQPGTQAYLQRAVDTGLAMAAIPLKAAHANEYLVFKAIYADKPKPGLDPVVERRKLISGIVAITVDAQQLLPLEKVDHRTSIALAARPVLEPGKRVALFKHEAAVEGMDGHWAYGALHRERDVLIGEQGFLVKFRRVLHWEDFSYKLLFAALFTGALFTLILWSLARTNQARAADLRRRNKEIEQLVEQRTQELATEKERALVTLESIADGVITADSQGVIDYLNPVAERLSGWSEQEVVGKPITDLFKVFDEKTLQEVANPVLQCLSNGLPFMRQENTIFTNRNGDNLAINESAAPIRDRSGQVTGVVLVFHDVSSTRKLTQQMSWQATHDALTGLPNRIMLQDYLESALEFAAQGGQTLAVMFLDLDRFKIVNDTLGHDVGDGLLREVAERLKEGLRGSDIVGRLGGDEFLVIASEIKDNTAIVMMAERLLKVFHKPFSLGQSEFFASTSIGISVYPEDGATPDVLMKKADSAMYRVKTQGKNNYGFYSKEADQGTQERFTLEADLRHALERQELVLHYQPQVSAMTGTVTGFEALIRWNHPSRGMIPPLGFLPLAEETGLIVEIGDWVMREACRQNQAWQQAGLAKVVIAVNIAHAQFMRPTLPAEVKQVLQDTGLAPQFLELELTESILAANAEEAVMRLKELKAAGIKLSIDDFGTGYSSLFYLKNFPLDSVKIDRCFIKDIETDHHDAEITTAIIAMSHSLKLSVVAEGVETATQLDFLRQKGCDTIQGYFYSPAVPAEQARAFLEKPLAGRSLNLVGAAEK
ncbi:MAG: EAL domain-containing protein [Gammaproteobacteria bacterium]|nr:EAL domain-containing protein [Gammaproteobacteria bacterium]